MSVWTRWPALRWFVPVVVATMAIGGGAAAGAVATSQPDLSPRSAAELLVALQTAEVPGLSGTVVHTAELGLPSLPETRGHGSADLSSLWSGSSTLRVWYGGPEQTRLALLGTLGQSDIIRDGRDVWVWNSTENRAVHWTLPASGPAAPHRPITSPLTPQEAADAALAAISPTTEVSTGSNARVAGRAAYELILAPRDEASLITQVRLAIDAEHGIPLGVQVFGAGEEPALEVRFTQISFALPDPEQFRFNPPPDATVEEGAPLAVMPFAGLGRLIRPEYAVVGESWATVLVVRVPGLREREGLEWLLRGLPPVSGEWGSGQVMSSSLISVLITDDDRVLLGAVTADRLTEVAGDPAAALRGE